ncbi:hypothetical protein BMF94_1940 [Rhodotorula taiwanensis]|uniref:RING-type domain-containing protein n=1 Tax=Rhodotorula taiwanensis TaxID=741276 RepID=A0A2S5BDW4_9BASI|nr:hypothetical protein BMF94_1940 [Rhodotorula taiwanensis]
MVISSDDDDSDDPDYTTAPSGRAGPSSYTGPSAFHPAANVGRARRALPTRAARATRFEAAYATDSDSEIEVVSERPASRSPPPPLLPARPPPPRARYSEFGAPIASPPPFIVPDGATPTTGTSSRRRSNPRRSTRIQAGADAPMNLPDDPVEADAALARALAQADANDRGVQDYLAGQTYGRGSGGPSRGIASRGGRGGAARGGAAADGGGRGYRGLMSDQGLIDLLMTSGYEALGGALWRGGINVFGGAGSLSGAYYGGGGGYGGPAGGWGGAAKVKAASKKYGVRMSHPTPVEKGFSRDIVEPRDPDAPVPDPSTTTATKKSRSKKPTEELEPVCASCLETLLLSGSGDKKVFGLRCGHVVCARCLNEAKGRCRAIREQEKGGWVVDSNGLATNGYKAATGKGKGKVPEMPGTLSLDDDDNDEPAPEPDATSSSRPAKRRRPNGSDSALPSTSSKGKGKGKSRADETGVEEDWTTCPVVTCDGKGSDLLAEEGWARPYEVFA